MSKIKTLNTLIIFDWDDTLFPTTWLMQNKININDPNIKNIYAKQFIELDNLLYTLLKKSLKYAHVIIITNALLNWVYLSSCFVPKTQQLINDKINVVSAKGIYQETFPYDAFKWKELAFKSQVTKYFGSKQDICNIISAGDAEFERCALIKLVHHLKIDKCYFKSVKLMEHPSYDILKDQIMVMDNSLKYIVDINKHLDLNFK